MLTALDRRLISLFNLQRIRTVQLPLVPARQMSPREDVLDGVLKRAAASANREQPTPFENGCPQ